MAAQEDVLPRSIQESLATAVALGTDDNCRAIANMVDPGSFDPPFGEIVGACVKYRKEYRRAPGKEHIDDVFADVLDDTGNKMHSQYERVISNMVRQVDGLETRFLLDRVTEFTRLRELRAALTEAAARYHRGGGGTVEEIEGMFREQLRQSMQRRRGRGFALSDDAALGFLDRDETESCPLGIPVFDRNDIKPAKGTYFNFLAPRGRGKCLDEDTLILLSSGRRATIREVVENRLDGILSLDESCGLLTETKITEYHDNGRRPCITITTTTGKRLTCTGNHPLLAIDGWCDAERLREGDYIACVASARGIGNRTPTVVTPEQARLLGYLVADGGLTAKTAVYYKKKTDPGVVEDFISVVRSTGDYVSDLGKNRESGAGTYLIISAPQRSGTKKRSRTIDWLEELGLRGCRSSQKFVPDCITGAPDNIIREFLVGLFSGDSSLYKGRTRWRFEYSSASERLVDDVRHLLVRLGIISRRRWFTASFDGKKLPGYAKLSISNKTDLIKLLMMIKLVGKKHKVSNQAMLDINEIPYTLPPAQCLPYETGEEVMYEKITSINSAGERHTYDITVPSYHNFTAGDIISHNSQFLGHVAKNAAMQRWRVAHYTLENSAEMTAQRYYQSIFGGVKRHGTYTWPQFKVDDRGEVSLHPVNINQNFVIEDRDKSRTYLRKQLRIEAMHSLCERIRIREYPTGRLSFSDLERDLDEMESIHGFVPDMLIVDAPQLMRLSKHEKEYSALDEAAIDLRGLGVERHMAVVATQQGNRGAESAEITRGYHAGGTMGIQSVADTMLTYSQTADEEARGLARLYAEKVRNDRARLTVLISQHYASGQFCLDSYVSSKKTEAAVKEYTNGGAAAEDA